MKWLTSVFMLLALVSSANAQVDPRVAPQALAVLQAQLAYYEAAIRAMQEDQKKTADYWAAYIAAPK